MVYRELRAQLRQIYRGQSRRLLRGSAVIAVLTGYAIAEQSIVVALVPPILAVLLVLSTNGVRTARSIKRQTKRIEREFSAEAYGFSDDVIVNVHDSDVGTEEDRRFAVLYVLVLGVYLLFSALSVYAIHAALAGVVAPSAGVLLSLVSTAFYVAIGGVLWTSLRETWSDIRRTGSAEDADGGGEREADASGSG
ncbi:hypothetical protein ACFQL9_00775 [Halobaculum lipolyticum]|uniref:DUF3278 domain-containing protein n=1 Tax=Halobaculum lipolyticum TaxID=3032001 RepID=A0ABD5W6V1_9EURY